MSPLSLIFPLPLFPWHLASRTNVITTKEANRLLQRNIKHRHPCQLHRIGMLQRVIVSSTVASGARATRIPQQLCRFTTLPLQQVDASPLPLLRHSPWRICGLSLCSIGRVTTQDNQQQYCRGEISWCSADEIMRFHDQVPRYNHLSPPHRRDFPTGVSVMVAAPARRLQYHEQQSECCIVASATS